MWKTSIIVVVLGVGLLSARAARAQFPTEDLVSVSDPDRLEALSFPRDATNVYLWSRAGSGALRSEGVRGKRPETWGTATGYTMIMNYQFQGASPPHYDLVNGASQGSWCQGEPTGECLGYAQIQAPEGATLDELVLWGYDDSVESDLHYALIANCDVGATQVNLILDSGDLVGSAGDFSFGSSYNPGIPIDNSQCGYTIRLKFTDGGEPPVGPSIRIRKARVAWTRQVSPGPASATFGDVPTDHPFFQYVEALAKSGITGGCSASPPLYCPDAPLTRGQMAVFLAKGLGLQWPE